MLSEEPVRASLLITCLVDTLFPDVGRASVAVLERVGVTVDVPLEQTCCGQMHQNAGHRSDARRLMRRTIDAFADAEVVVSPSPSCAAQVVHHYPALADASGDPGLAREARALAARTRDLSTFLLDDLGVEDVAAPGFPHAVTYHPTCHGLRLLGIGDRPQRLLSRVPGIELRELPQAESCCGFGGTFAVTNADVSTAMMTDKLRHAADTGAEILTAADSSCLMHLAGGLSRTRSRMRAMHYVEILAGESRS
ncbi:putative L-lactate dehydrogenase Fe-S oxidoreductase subunit YkgE [Patulibacter medicamentivorans]|uniref:Putative L-lactate dehydrogenase Fe-S oxidoreductase subunit YkgE n=1 Tax=Patulibacter medicamentivorans TaxID=1097667 RepID=H0E1Y4_9ACTN|nr:putative L-lactate dehydrogenase Fe-S oxidoreductase subunit YkgE [Patulibacter medicamentivorans]